MWNWIKCNIFNCHEYTCATDEGIKVTEAQIAAGVEGFYDYAKMYCKHCGYVYVPTKRNG